MKTKSGTFAVAVLTVSLAAILPCRAEDYDLLKAKTKILVTEMKEFYESSGKKDSYVHGAQYEYYFQLVHTIGTNLLARTDTPTNEKLLQQYFTLIKKDYDAYTKVGAATDKAAATGRLSGNAGDRHRAKRLVNAEKLRDKELTDAIKRWEKFVEQLKRSKK